MNIDVFKRKKNLILLILSVCGSTKAQSAGTSGIVRTFDDVPLEGYGPDPCKPVERRMPDFRAPGRRISDVKCFEYVWRSKYGSQELERNIECSIRQGSRFVLGGREANLGESSHVGAIGFKSASGDWIFKCGASLISEKFALTAAHCTHVLRDPSVADPVPKIVRLGARTINNVEKYTRATDANITRIIVHPQYRSPRLYYDIALIEFEREAPFDMLVHPSCLHHNSQLAEKATVAGWGVVDLATLTESPTLQVADVAIIDSNLCNRLLRSKFNRNFRGTLDHQMCAGNLSGGVDTCQGDSGGPLAQAIPQQNNNYSRWTVHRIVGVTSFGYGCARANSPGIYSRVASFIDWIESIVWPSENSQRPAEQQLPSLPLDNSQRPSEQRISPSSQPFINYQQPGEQLQNPQPWSSSNYRQPAEHWPNPHSWPPYYYPQPAKQRQNPHSWLSSNYQHPAEHWRNPDSWPPAHYQRPVEHRQNPHSWSTGNYQQPAEHWPSPHSSPSYSYHYNGASQQRQNTYSFHYFSE